MLSPAALYDVFQVEGVTYFVGVPDSLLKSICAYITDHVPARQHVIAVNEGTAVALATGHHLATGETPMVYMQNSGLGNTVNPLLSLADPEIYAIPMLLMIGWRGEPGVKDEPQHSTQGRVTLAMLESMGIPYAILPETADHAATTIRELVTDARQRSGPAALLVKKDTLETYTLQHQPHTPYPMVREEVIAIILDHLPEDAVIVGTTGKTSREIFEHRARQKQGHHRDFLTVGGMGHASQIALGLAQASSDRPVYCLDGDGAALMHLGALASNAALGGGNFHHIILNNAAHDSVGGQPTLGFAVNFPAIANAVGYQMALQVDSAEHIAPALTRLAQATGPAMLEIRIRSGSRKELGRPTTTPQENKKALMQWLGTKPEA